MISQCLFFYFLAVTVKSFFIWFLIKHRQRYIYSPHRARQAPFGQAFPVFSAKSIAPDKKIRLPVANDVAILHDTKGPFSVE